MRKIITTTIVLMLLAVSPAMAENSACCSSGWEAKDLRTAEGLLDGICRGSTSDNEDMKGYSCQARQAVISALDKLGWCYGKIGEIGAKMRWHKCTRGSQHTDVKNLHTYDWDENTHTYRFQEDPK
jgi:hypothetical protein